MWVNWQENENLGGGGPGVGGWICGKNKNRHLSGLDLQANAEEGGKKRQELTVEDKTRVRRERGGKAEL